jgi:GDPmannose 4,6-dehydratase
MTGKTYTIEDFLEEAFAYAGIEDWSKFVVIDKEFYRPCEVDYLRGDCSKAKSKLGWKPKYDFQGLVKMMLDAKL